MRKRGRVVALGVLLVLASVLAFLTSPQPVSAYPCCITNDACSSDEYCAWPSIWSCVFMGECVRLWPSQCASYSSADECGIDPAMECGAGKYCSFGTKTEYVAFNHQCQNLQFNECLTCSYPTADCNYNSGCETSLASDANNCGSCGNTCDTGEMYK